MVKENEGHGFRNEENRFDFYRAMEKFLGKHLGGRVEAETQQQNGVRPSNTIFLSLRYQGGDALCVFGP